MDSDASTADRTVDTPDLWLGAARGALEDAKLCLDAGNHGGAGSYSWEVRGYLMRFEKEMADADGRPLRADFYGNEA